MPADRQAYRLETARWTLLALLTGRAEALGTSGHLSGIAKQPVSCRTYIAKCGASGDEQGDRVHHGGEDKAIHHYAFEHYAQWASELPSRDGLFAAPGLFGENFSSLGLTESNVCVGDIYQVGTALLQVSQARQPCWKLNLRTSVADMANRVQLSGRTGWYYRVLTEGWVQRGDEIRLLLRPHPQWPLQRLIHYLYVDRLNRDALADIAALPVLSKSWRTLARKRLEGSVIENWAARLDVPQEHR